MKPLLVVWKNRILKIEVLIHALASPANIFVNVARTQIESDQFLLTHKFPPAKETDTVEDSAKNFKTLSG